MADGCRVAEDQVGLHRHQLSREDPRLFGIPGCIAVREFNGPAISPSQLLEPTAQLSHIAHREWIGGCQTHEHPDAPYSLALLRTRRERRENCGAKPADKFASSHVPSRAQDRLS
jgi:hypothetical protein